MKFAIPYQAPGMLFLGLWLFSLQLDAQAPEAAHQQLYAELGAASAYLSQDPDSTARWMLRLLHRSRELNNGYGYASAYNGRSQALFYAGRDPEAAYQWALGALDSIPAYLGKDNAYYASALVSLGAFCQRQGQWQQAAAYFDQSKAIYARDASNQAGSLAMVTYTLGNLFREMGDHLQALAHFEAGVKAGKQAGQAYLPYCYLGMGRSYRALEKWEQARAAYRSLPASAQPPQQRNALYGLAYSFLDEGKAHAADSALPYLQQAEQLRMQFELGNPQVGKEIQARIWSLQGKDAEALGAFQEAQALRTEDSRASLPDFARGQRLIAGQWARMGAYDKAMQAYGRALDYLCVADGKGDGLPKAEEVLFPQEAMGVLLEMAEASNQQAEKLAYEQALRAAELGIELGRKLLTERLAEPNQLLLATESKALYEQALESCYRLHLLDPTGEHEYQALCLWESYQQGLLGQARFLHQQFSDAMMPDSLLRRDRELRMNLAMLRTKVIDRVAEKADSKRIGELKASLFQQMENYRRFRTTVARDWPAFEAMPEVPSWERLAPYLKNMGQKSAFWGCFIGEEHAFSFFSEAGLGLVIFRKMPNRQRLEAQLEPLLEACREPGYRQEEVEAFARASFRLFRNTIGDQMIAEGCKRLLLVPDGPLAYLPFECLLTERYEPTDAAPTQAFRNFPYLFQRYALQYGHSLMLSQSPQGHPQQLGSEMLAFAPEYEGGYRLPQNPQTGGAVMAGLQGRLVETDFADAFRQQAGKYPQLYLGVHGYLDEEDPQGAYLQFPPHDSAGSRVYAYEIYNLPLQAGLVSLVACDGGGGRLEAGEGVMSLSRAFTYAGAGTVIQSRWTADAGVAAQLFPSFYQHLSAGERGLNAFTRARRDYLSKASPDYVHPHYWATYAYWGEDVELDGGWFIQAVMFPGFVVGPGRSFLFFSKKN
jgi:CHAT domain-containing protein